MRVLFLTHYYPPEVGAPQARISALAHGLSQRGFEVAVHTGFPNYPEGRILEPYRNRLVQREQNDGVSVIRSAVFPAPNQGFAPRLANQVSFAASSVATAPRAPKVDVVVVESPPLFTAAAAIAYRSIKRAALVVNVADRWPASAVELGALTNRTAIRAAAALEDRIYASADLITVPTRGLARDLEALPHAAGKVERIPPAVDLDHFDPRPAERTSGPLQVLYAGTIGLAQGVDTLNAAARIAGGHIVQVKVAGGGAEAEALAADPPVNVELLGVVSHAEVASLYRQAEAAVVLLRDRPIFEGALPTKTLEAMAAGRPVVVSARGEAADFVTAAGAGIAVPPEDPEALATALHQLQAAPAMRERLGAAGRAYAERELGREASLDRWQAAIERAAHAATRR